MPARSPAVAPAPANPSFELTSAGGTAWPVFAHDEQRTSFQPLDTGITPSNVAKLALRWSWTAPWHDDYYASPILVDGTLYVLGISGRLAALDAKTGALKWWVALNNGSTATPAYLDGILFVSTHVVEPASKPFVPSTFYALNPQNGATLWSRQVPAAIQSSPVTENGLVFVGISLGDKPYCRQGGIYIFNEKTGARGPQWLTAPGAQPDGGGVWSPLSLAPDGKILFGTSNTCNQSVATANSIVEMSVHAKTTWSINTANPLEDNDVGGGVTVIGNEGYVIGKNGTLYEVNVDSGTVTNARYLGAPYGDGAFGTPSYTDSTVMVWGGFAGLGGSYPGGLLYGLTPDLKKKWKIVTHYLVRGGYVAATANLAFVPLDNSLAALDPSTGKILWRYATSAYFDSSAVVASTGLFAADASGTVYAFGVPSAKDRFVPATHPRAWLYMPMPARFMPKGIPKYCRIPG
ncbi:MAG TPA: PQQ-binding-like beta-propeller repeat protein [Verrucomicrobiae bacterium]|nr:PQQ-binding-like beta-propeller repeat protein [Verrucomicrobiae bacterium]